MLMLEILIDILNMISIESKVNNIYHMMSINLNKFDDDCINLNKSVNNEREGWGDKQASTFKC